MGGDPADGNAGMFKEGAVSVMEAAGIKAAQEPPGIWDQEKSATNFENALTANGGKVDAVWSANDANAAGVISILQKNKLTGVPISGQDAQLAALQFILTGWQTATVYKPVKDEADAAVETAVALLKGDTPRQAPSWTTAPRTSRSPRSSSGRSRSRMSSPQATPTRPRSAPARSKASTSPTSARSTAYSKRQSHRGRRVD